MRQILAFAAVLALIAPAPAQDKEKEEGFAPIFNGKDLDDWVYGTKTPRMPGHPDWTVDPVVENAPTALSAPAARALPQRRK